MLSIRWLGFVVALSGCSEAARPTMVVSTTVPLVGGEPDTATRGVVGIVAGESGCTGSLIAPNLVLTARHCVASINSPNGTVQCGVTTFGAPFSASEFVVTPDDNLRNGVPDGSQFGVERVVTTPGTGVCGNDVSLLILSSNISNTAAPLLVPRVDGPVTANESFDAVGYGITNPNDTQGATFGQRLRVDDLDVGCVGTECSNLGGTRTEWGAVTPVCSGDSGGPALDAQGRVIGVASRGNVDCSSALYGAVASWRSLIVDTAIDAATSGGYAPPSWTGSGPADAGTMDAGMTDAGTNDGGPVGPDGGQSDAGSPDAGSPDSGTPDAGSPDSGTPDAGSPDAGSSDAGSPDSGSPDGGGVVPDGGATLGEPCDDGRCGGNFACYFADGDDVGVCVPPCSADEPCPFRHTCSERLGVCVPTTPEREDPEPKSQTSSDAGGCGCRAAVRPDGRSAFAFVALVLGAFARRRSRKSR